MPANDLISSFVSSQSTEIQHVPFNTDIFHDVIEVVTMPDGRDGAVLKRLCENLKTDFSRQLRKVKNNPLAGMAIMSIPDPRGVPQDTWVIPVNKIAWWLGTINAKKVKASISPKLLKYQEALADVLDAWCRGKTREQVTTAPAVPLTPAQILLAQAQILVDFEKKQTALAKQQEVLAIESKDHEQRLQQVEAQSDKTISVVTTITEYRGRILGIPGLAKRGYHVPENMQPQVGKELTAIAKAHGDNPPKVANGKYEVGQYFPEHLDEWVSLNKEKRSSWRR